MKEFWNSMLTKESWEELKKLNKRYEFVLIGGWAVWLLTKQKKSKDIDIVVDFEELEKIKREESLSKNKRLRKYEIKKKIDIDVYVKYWSDLTGINNIGDYSMKTLGFTVPKPGFLLVLKQEAYEDRKNSVKGQKDEIDVLSLLFFSDISFREYKRILYENGKEGGIDKLLRLVRGFRDYSLLDITPQEFKKMKKRVICKLKKL